MADFLHPIVPPITTRLIQSISETLSLQTLPHHINKTFAALFFFQIIYKHLAPQISILFFPNLYHSLSSADRSDWNMRVVSLSQCTIISTFSLYLLTSQRETRSQRGWVERIHGHDEMEGHLLSIAIGYFAWHLVLTVVHRRRYGWAMVAHGVICFVCFSTSYVSLGSFCGMLTPNSS